MSAVASPGGGVAVRAGWLDALRGAAMLWMAGFHFAFDLNHVGILHQDFYTDRLWTWQRTCILSLFLLCAGAGSAIADARGQLWPRFWRRWAQVAGCALLVSAASWWMFPQSWISFGVLHGMAVMLLIARFTSRAGRWTWVVGAVAIALPHFVHDAAFDTRATNWTGLVTRLPVTEDYVPLLPWLGVLLWGQAGGAWVLQHRPRWLAVGAPRRLRAFATLGRWPLTFYMLHQPVLLGLLTIAGFTA